MDPADTSVMQGGVCVGVPAQPPFAESRKGGKGDFETHLSFEVLDPTVVATPVRSAPCSRMVSFLSVLALI